MQTRFEVEDEDAFEEARVELVDDFDVWARKRGLNVDTDVAFEAVTCKVQYLDGDLGRWRVADLDELLLCLYPRKVIVEEGRLPLVVPSMHAFLDYLQDAGLFAGGGHPLPALHAALDGLTAPFAEAMADPSRHGPAKALFMAMRTEEVAIDDPDAVQRFMDDFNARSFEERAALIPGPPRETLPPVLLPGDDELAELAAATTMLRRLRALVAFVGEGRRLTQAGNLALADGKALVALLDTDDPVDVYGRTRSATQLREVDLTFRLALSARLVKKAKGTLSATRKGRAIERAPLQAWREALVALLGLGLAGSRYDGAYLRPFWTDFLDEGALELLALLCITREPLPISFLQKAAWEQVVGLVDPDDPWHERSETAREWVSRDLEHVLDRLEFTGALVRDEPDGQAGNAGAAVRLTSLGTWLARPVLIAHGYDVPLVGDLADANAGTLLRAIAARPPDEARAEFLAWVAARGSAAVEELAEALRAEADPAERTLAAGVLIWLPDDAAAGMRELRDDPLLGAYARLWLVDRGLAPRSSLDPADGTRTMIETLAGILALEGAESMVEYFRETAPDPGSAVHTVDALWDVDSPHTGPVLQALIDSGGRDLGKAGRRSLFKRRSRPRG